MGRLWAGCGRGPSTLRRFQASSAISRSTVCAVRVIEATELLALDVFNAGGRQITLGDVEHYLHELRGHVDECRCGRCAAAAMRYPHAAAGRDEAIAAALYPRSRWASSAHGRPAGQAATPVGAPAYRA